jgi:hypothetical protein
MKDYIIRGSCRLIVEASGVSMVLSEDLDRLGHRDDFLGLVDSRPHDERDIFLTERRNSTIRDWCI